MNTRRMFPLVVFVVVFIVACGGRAYLEFTDVSADRTDERVAVEAEVMCVTTNVHDCEMLDPYCVEAFWYEEDDFEDEPPAEGEAIELERRDFEEEYFGDAEPVTSGEQCDEAELEPEDRATVIIESDDEIPEDDDHLVVISVEETHGPEIIGHRKLISSP